MLTTVLCAACSAGFATFAILSVHFHRQYEHFKYAGDMKEAALECQKTAAIFAVGAIIAALPDLVAFFNAHRLRIRTNQKHVLPGAYRDR